MYPNKHGVLITSPVLDFSKPPQRGAVLLVTSRERAEAMYNGACVQNEVLIR